MKRKIFTLFAEAFSSLEPKTNVEVLPNPGKPDITRVFLRHFYLMHLKKLSLGYKMSAPDSLKSIVVLNGVLMALCCLD
jgi:hypothetical protein